MESKVPIPKGPNNYFAKLNNPKYYFTKVFFPQSKFQKFLISNVDRMEQND